QHVPNPTTTTTTTSTTSTTAPNSCAMGPGTSGPTCGGTCSGPTACLNSPPQSPTCVCANVTQSCGSQPFPTCSAGLCAGMLQQCRPGATTCGCCGLPSAQCVTGSECCTGVCSGNQCQ